MNSWQLNKVEARALAKINSAGVDCSLIYLTATGLEKSILDATAPVRKLLFDSGVHDFADQRQGPGHKVKLECTYFVNGNAVPATVSLYRPNTKKGDPRLWPYGLKDYAQPRHVLALFIVERQIYIVNLSEDVSRLIQLDGSQMRVEDSLLTEASELTQFLESLTLEYNARSNELLFKLRALSASGPLKAIGTGATAIGRTIETYLGIDINSSPQPDYKGIEIKSSRTSSNVRSSLFAKVADWDISRFKSSRELVEEFGYERDGENCRRLYCSVSSQKPNSQGLLFDLDFEAARLDELFKRENIKERVCAWRLSSLHDKLQQKHKETFWISANQLDENGTKYFELESIKHTRRPSSMQFDRLLDCGEISMDHLIKLDYNTGGCVEKGPLFKIWESSIDELFMGQPQLYGLQ